MLAEVHSHLERGPLGGKLGQPPFAAAHDELPGGDHEGFGEGLAAQQAHLAALLLA